MDLSNPEVIELICTEAKDFLTKEYKKLIKETQEKEADIFGFGKYIQAMYPQYWNKQIKSNGDNSKYYKNLSVDIHIDLKITRLGMKAN